MTRRRVLCIFKNYPQLSQTYIKTELRVLTQQCDLEIIATSVPNYPDPEALPYRQIGAVDEIIAAARAYKPDVIHGHYLVQAQLIHQVADAVGVPFTIRAHSFDSLPAGPSGELPEHLIQLPSMINDDLCLGVLAMPFARSPLVERVGLTASKVISSPPVVDFEHFYDRGENGRAVMNTGACIPKKAMDDYVRIAARMRKLTFDLYAIGHLVNELRELNTELGSPVQFCGPVPYQRMRGEYKKHAWLLYTASFTHKTVGWPMAVLEAQAAGVVVYMAHIRPDVADYLAGTGYLYRSLDEAEAILSNEPPGEMRARGFDHARDLDIRRHIHLLTDLWEARR